MKAGLILFMLFAVALTKLHAQGDAAGSALPQLRAAQALYLQGGGGGGIVSFQYDRRFMKRASGPGFSLGVGLYSGGGSGSAIFPLVFNYLLGRQKHFAEVGAGASLFTGRISFADVDVAGGGLFYQLNLGYRYQTKPRGFFGRIGLSPLFFANSKDITIGYLGLGYGF